MARAVLILLMLLPLLAGCERSTTQVVAPVAITTDDVCAVCGMSIHHHPGPKGQLFLIGDQRPAKFCSTVDLFAYALQPEHQNRIAQVYVHDMTGVDWQQPADAAFIPAKEAWFVVGHGLSGGMGPTLAAFHDSAAAQTFIDQHGGRMLPYSDVTLGVLQELHEAGFSSAGGHHHHH